MGVSPHHPSPLAHVWLPPSGESGRPFSDDAPTKLPPPLPNGCLTGFPMLHWLEQQHCLILVGIYSCSRNFGLHLPSSLPACLRLASSLIWLRKILTLLLLRQRHIGNPVRRAVHVIFAYPDDALHVLHEELVFCHREQSQSKAEDDLKAVSKEAVHDPGKR